MHIVISNILDFSFNISICSPLSQIHTFSVTGVDLEQRGEPSRNLAKFLCRLRQIKTLMITETKLHSDFYTTLPEVMSCQVNTVSSRCKTPYSQIIITCPCCVSYTESSHFKIFIVLDFLPYIDDHWSTAKQHFVGITLIQNCLK